MFAVSWRNPDAGQAGWGVDTYGQAVLDAMDAAEHVARTPRTALMAFGAGGTLTAMVLGHLAAIGAQERVASVTFGATVLDREAGKGTATADPLTWPGRPAPDVPREVRFWHADTLRVPAGVQRGLSDVVERGALASPGAAYLLGTTIDLAKVDRDCYVVVGAGDRVAPWPDVHRVTRLLAGSSRFVLADGGHLGSLVSPPGEPGLTFRTAASVTGAAADGGPPHGWVALTATEPGSWWEDHLTWLTERTGPAHDAPPELGGRGMHALAPAPGEYVRS
ncbi:hypothetical protein BJF78_32365 [Pseudonocardia sp. CNS-139]|nr:hypothetical protein BJF78_32365 [Pseudonocardia sp. CNS-139]